jgi:hypothetical protein
MYRVCGKYSTHKNHFMVLQAKVGNCFLLIEKFDSVDHNVINGRFCILLDINKRFLDWIKY